MIASWLKSLWGDGHKRPISAGRPRLELPRPPAAIYAIGDVHGRLDLLKRLEADILADGAEIEGPKLIVLLGDVIDRGPHSAQVVDHILKKPPPGWQRLTLAGNHEQSFCNALHDPRMFETWLGFGGLEMLGSYGIGQRELKEALGHKRRLEALLQASIPPEHLDFFAQLPVSVAAGNYLFVHSGGRPNVADDHQSDEDLLWYKGPRTNSRTDNIVVVHGHEIVEYPDIHPSRINVDTGAYSSGILTAVRLIDDLPPRFMQTGTEQH